MPNNKTLMMKLEIPERLKTIFVRKPKVALSKPTLCVDWDRQEIRFAIVSLRGKSFRLHTSGRLERVADVEPLLQLSEYLRSEKRNVQQLLLILSRSDLELITLNVPPVDRQELPLLIDAEVLQRLGDSEAPPISDYVEGGLSEETSSREVMAFALTQSQIDGWVTQAQNAKLKLIAVTSRHLAPLAMLRTQGLLTHSRSVSISFYAGEVEIVVCAGTHPRFLRTLRIGSDDPGSLAEQIGLEIQRSLSLLHEADVPASLELFIFQTSSLPSLMIEALRERKLGTLHTIDVMQAWQRSGGSVDEVDSTKSGEAVLGAGWDLLHESLPIDLLNPKRPPKPVHPARKWATIGSAAVLAASIGSYVLYSDVQDLRSEVERLEPEADNKQRMANKLLEKADDVDLVEEWLADRVDWLEELRELSNRLPNGQNASVRRLTASVGPDGGRFELAVQVRQPEHIAELEESLRSARFDVSSQRVSQQPTEDEFPWQFDTEIRFPLRTPSAAAYIPSTDADSETPSDSEATADADKSVDAVPDEDEERSDGESAQ